LNPAQGDERAVDADEGYESAWYRARLVEQRGMDLAEQPLEPGPGRQAGGVR
jgi:hypothetical protein